MTINSTAAASGPFIGTGVAQTIPFEFHAASADEVRVEVNGAPVDGFSVVLEDDGTGSVTGVFALNGVIYVESAPSFTQETVFNRFAPYFPDSLNPPLDRAAIRDIALADRLDRTFVIPRNFVDAAGKFPQIDDAGQWQLVEGVPGIAGPAGAFRMTLAALKASPITDGQSTYDGSLWIWTLGDFTARASDPNVVAANGIALSTGAWVRSTEIALATRYGAKGNGVANDAPALLTAAAAARTTMSDGLRTFAGEIHLPPGRYRIQDVVQLAPPNGVAGLTISGSGAGCTEIVFANSAATIKCAGGRAVTFRDLTFRSIDPVVDGPVTPYGIDMNQTAFTIEQTGSPLRSWRFERCDFAGLWKCFKVTGASLCSEFYFDKCGFSQCFHLMDNDNDQAVNWNFVDCNWENEGLDTTKDKNTAAMFLLQAGTSVNWRGGSSIFWGRMVYYNVTAPNKVQSTSHFMSFDGVRMELVDGGAGTHVPFIDRVSTGYAAGNAPVVRFARSTIINRGAIQPTTVYARMWNGCKFSFDDCEFEGGRVSGILDGLTTSSNATLSINNTARLDYVEDATARVNDHDAHAVDNFPPFGGGEGALITSVRPSTLASMASSLVKMAYSRSPTGNLPRAGTTVPLGSLPVHSIILRLFIRSFETVNVSFTVELRDQADTTTYASASIAPGGALVFTEVNKEIGFQIPNTPLMLKVTGTDYIAKGMAGIEYL